MRIRSSLVLTLPLFAPLSHSAGIPAGSIKNLITFGDSYTDIVNTGDHGTAWPVYAADYGKFNLHSYAISGAACDERLTPRNNGHYIVQDELPAYFNDTKNGLKLSPKETIYTIWIGTNDVGDSTLLTGQQSEGTTIVQVTQCAVNWVKTLYDSGARNFLFQNMLPLQLVTLYRKDAYLPQSWPIPHNQTEWSIFMTELVSSGNEISRLMLQQLGRELAGAHIGLFDSNSLFQDMFDHPANYLNGTAPLNVTGSISSCPVGAPCTLVSGTDRDSYLWYDELHPSEQADRQLARQIVDAVQHGSRRWTTWFS
ncbi:hypothetical protein QCA50_016688 [Cerrena zonata]|uniref:Carbohydrate esterase family 16 protein n=1 Tax=Cerrena zonata TaxID=2478898 RepID=A0AAW0FMF4_9APHY